MLKATKLNGQIIFSKSSFNQQQGMLERSVELKPNNILSVTLYSKPDSYLTIKIYKFVNPPEISFTANPETIQYQQFSTLSWNVLYADSISIDNGMGSLIPADSIKVFPGIPSSTYTLTGVNLGGITKKQVVVTVNFPVPTVSLQASPIYRKTGESTTLAWSSFAAHTVSIEPGIGSVELNGTREVTMSDTTTFTINALGYGGTQTADATVTIDNIEPQINITYPAGGTFINSPNVKVKGQVMDSSPVTLKMVKKRGQAKI